MNITTPCRAISKHAITAALIACTLLAQSCSEHSSTSSQSNISITAEPPHIRVRYLDGIEWEQHSEFGRAFTDWAFICRPQIQLKELTELRKGNTSTFEVTAISVKLQLDLTQTLPFGVKEPLRKHEEMHCTMTAEIYKQAPKIATEIAKNMIGRKIVVESNGNSNGAKADAEIQATREFKSEYKKAVSNEADELAKIFDRITKHGMNDVTNEDGSRRSFEERKSQKHDGEKKQPERIPSGSSLPSSTRS
jgi:hypothetical protein